MSFAVSNLSAVSAWKHEVAGQTKALVEEGVRDREEIRRIVEARTAVQEEKARKAWEEWGEAMGEIASLPLASHAEMTAPPGVPPEMRRSMFDGMKSNCYAEAYRMAAPRLRPTP